VANIGSIVFFIFILALIYVADYRPHLQSANTSVKVLYTSLLSIGFLACLLYMLHVPGFALRLT